MENEAMELDRYGAIAEAADMYRRAATRLREAAAACPLDHPDRRVLQEHASEVSTRAAYLDGLEGSNDVPAIPLEEHINSVRLAMGTSTAPVVGDMFESGEAAFEDTAWTVISAYDDRAVVCAAAAIGGATGLLLMGPVSGAALSAVAAYATTREDTAGCAARKVGTAGVRVVSRARCIDEEYRISDRAANVGQSALGQIVALGSRSGISDGAKTATTRTQQVLNNFNERHKVADRLNWGFGAASYAFSNLVSKATGR